MKTLLLFICILITAAANSQTWQWAARGGGSDGDGSSNVSEDERIQDMAVDALGNIYVTGRIRPGSNINGTPLTTFGNYDIFLAKFDCLGNLIWSETAGGNQDDEALAISISNDGHIYITGRVRSSPINTFIIGDTSIAENTVDLFLAKYDTAGNFKWVRIAAPGNAELGSVGLSVGVNIQGEILAVFRGVINGMFAPGYNIGGQKDYIIKYDNQGNIISLDSLGEMYIPVFPNGRVIITKTGEIYGYGTFQNPFTIGSTNYTPQGSQDLLVIKYNSDATLAWVYTQGYAGTAATVKGVAIDNFGYVYISGNINNGYVFGNDTTQNTLNSASFPFIAKLDPNGQALWSKTISTSASSGHRGITLDNSGNIYVTTLLYGQGIFGSQNITSIGQSNNVLVKYDNNGNLLWAEMLNSTGGIGDEVPYLQPDSAGNIYLGGSFKNTVTINGNNITSAGGKTDFLLVKHGMASCVVGIDELSGLNYGIHAYPNPSTGKFLIRLEKFIPNQNNVVSVYNNIGQWVKEERIEFPGIAEIDISGTSAGIYHVRAFNGERYVNTKVVVRE